MCENIVAQNTPTYVTHREVSEYSWFFMKLLRGRQRSLQLGPVHVHTLVTRDGLNNESVRDVKLEKLRVIDMKMKWLLCDI